MPYGGCHEPLTPGLSINLGVLALGCLSYIYLITQLNNLDQPTSGRQGDASSGQRCGGNSVDVVRRSFQSMVPSPIRLQWRGGECRSPECFGVATSSTASTAC